MPSSRDGVRPIHLQGEGKHQSVVCNIGSKIGTTHCVACKQPHNANGVTPNTVIDSNDEPAGNNQQRMVARGY